MKILSPILLAAALLCCGGCSTVRMSYDHADIYLRFKIHGYTSFNAQQKDDIRREVDAYMSWHRKNALPEYIAFLQEIFSLVQPGRQLRKEDIARLRGEYGRLYKKSISQAIRPAARMLNALDNRQIEDLAKAFSKKIKKHKDEKFFASEQRNLAMRAERNIDFVKKLTGKLSDDQEEKIIELSLSMPFVSRHYLEYREASQTGLLALLNSKAGEEKIQAYIWSWINTPEVTRTPQQQQAIQSYEIAMDEMTVRIYDLLTDRQKEHLRKEVLKYIEDFQYLNAEKVTTGAASRQEARAAETR